MKFYFILPLLAIGITYCLFFLTSTYLVTFERLCTRTTQIEVQPLLFSDSYVFAKAKLNLVRYIELTNDKCLVSIINLKKKKKVLEYISEKDHEESQKRTKGLVWYFDNKLMLPKNCSNYILPLNNLSLEISENWTYVPEVNDHWQTPQEFVATGRGDLEEIVNTYASILRANYSPENLRVGVGLVSFGYTTGKYMWVEVYENGSWYPILVFPKRFYIGKNRTRVAPTIQQDYFFSHKLPIVKLIAYYNDVYLYPNGTYPKNWIKMPRGAILEFFTSYLS